MKNTGPVLTVSEITRYVKELLQGDFFLGNLWVTGEISNFKHHRSGHMYFTLKDSYATLRCVFFRRENLRCRFQPANGMEVIVHGYISVYEPDGVYQLYVAEMEPAGMGSLFLAFEQLKKKLEQEGLFSAEHKRKLPFLPRKIGLVTSPTGAALQDILATVQKRFPHVHLVVAESLMQGDDAPEDIVRSLELLNRYPGIELIIVARGGGSIEDLWPFNTEVVARAIHRSRIPVISAVGHETDFTIADFVADYRAATPTAAVAAALPDMEDLIRQLEQCRIRAGLALQRRLQQEKQLLDYTVGSRFYRKPLRLLQNSRERLRVLEGRLRQETVRLLQLKGMKLAALDDKLESYSPLKVMNRGYSYCRDERGRIIRSVKGLKVGDLLRLTFKDGEARCRTEAVEEGTGDVGKS
ncbi:MAG: exodeoxyribonuclease VII large subunit [Dethiobacteria bacterium]|jgi:exodeoxyribonuclease VII large subunit|nr:exodeoxyribonuclease VII large subunit [Bacillota bacterium]HOP68951.1 exodeoxyribonuclease VII large subunit [Bacillota bacterium]HPT33901.1 exodeoxyribonuclease VII large subunit [Bacillota bacterium]HQD06153.1 exodeoxyribonuclease VII large subunit [Bacillota bacterium]